MKFNSIRKLKKKKTKDSRREKKNRRIIDRYFIMKKKKKLHPSNSHDFTRNNIWCKAESKRFHLGNRDNRNRYPRKRK